MAPAALAALAAPKAGFDDLFAGLGAESEPVAVGDDSGAERPVRSKRAARAARKAEKAAAPGSRRSSALPAPTVDVVPPASGTSPGDDLAAVISASAVSASAPATRQPTDGPDGRRSRRAAEATGSRRGAPRRPPAASTSTSAASSRPAPKGRSKRVNRFARVTSGFVAMSFAAMLALATSVPSLSLLSPADVQAMALEPSVSIAPGQVVEFSGNAVAQTVQRDGFETQTIDEYAQAAGIRAEATFTNNPSGTIQWPFAVGVHIGDHFGYRDCAGCSSDHGGQDFNPGLGAEIQSIADGVVVNSTDSGGSLGVVMMIDHMIDGKRVTSVYAHMVHDSRRFETGDTVKVGDVIGQTGDTGMSTGPHLHFEIRLGGMSGTKVDPLEWLYANTN
ncbi:M23 family metallopeptidase [Agromyces laixinhei]|uniref:M23 family metallopeptidase n=1 Tax=Agromyces laixinhei TaxID=2585717 RepID=UPI0018DD9AD2|nr:M23 family metallopeptidase [Agromyces laixinhei]